MIRRATIDDLPAIAGLYHDVWHETHAAFMPAAECRRRSPAFFRERMGLLQTTTLVHEARGEIAGFAAWKGHFLGQVFLRPADRGGGIAEGLLAAAEAAMRDDGVEEAELHCVVGNHRARRFYKRRGWRAAEVLQLPMLADDGMVDVAFWRMTKPLVHGTYVPS